MPDDPSAALEYYRERGKREVAAARDVVTRHSGENILTLVAALGAALALHSRWEIRGGDDGEGEFERAVCRHCCAADGGGQTEDCAVIHWADDECWPCSTVRAITSALTGEERSDGH